MIPETAISRLSAASLNGDYLVELFKELENMVELTDVPQVSLVLGYIDNPNEIKMGDFLPSITLSLTRFVGESE